MNTHDEMRRHAQRYYGKYAGTVKSNEDEDKRGRLKVIVPAIFGPKVEVWARPCFPAGQFFVPPKDALVWVEFEGGDRHYPIWVGTWFAKDKLPEGTDLKPPELRLIHTPGGHRIELKDKDDEEIVVKHKGGASIKIDKDGKIIVKNKDGKAKVELDGSKATVTADDIILKGDCVLDGKVKLGGDGASSKIILGDKFESSILSQLISHTHPTSSPGAPTAVSVSLAALSMSSCTSDDVKAK